jgi:dienelactone hydrolase
LKVGAAGFCWGGLYTIFLAADGPSTRVHPYNRPEITKPLIDAAFTAHPSLVKVPRDIEAVTLPLNVAIGDEDTYMKGPLILQMKNILERKEGGHEVVIMPGARHGFAIRTDPNDEVQMGFAARAEDQALAWFGKWFA